jgi:Fur family ferric uptake transcriptional regulator
MMPNHTGNFREELESFERYLLKHSLKRSRQREIILERFLETKGHLSVDDLYRIIQRTHPEIGRTTIYRTLKLLCDAEIARAIELQDGLTRFETLNKDEHHDHMVCTRCGTIVEFTSEAVEKVQEQIARANGFTVDSHRHQIFGRCQKCRRRRSSTKTRGNQSRSRTSPEPPADPDGAALSAPEP